MPELDWNARYAEGFIPWDTATPEPLLVEVVADRALRPGRALDIGCGTGTHALWLAEQGFDVVGVDVAERAVAQARARAAHTRPAGSVRFVVLDFLREVPDGGPFDLVFDRGVFHVFDAAEDREAFAARVARCLAPSGVWLSLIGSTEGPPRDEGPPRRSARDTANAIEPSLQIVELRQVLFDRDAEVPKQAWCCVSRQREYPAQPSTQR